MARIYTFVNQKGGVGKTTTTINLGAYLAHFGQRVLLVDLDPQANATSCLGIDKATVKSGTYEAIMGLHSAADSILVSPELKLSLLPASPALAGAEVELVNELARENKLREALAPLKDKYDYILIDCPPSLGLLTLNGMVAAQDGIIIPVQCEYLALEGLSMLLSTIERVRKALFPRLRVRGVLLTMYDNRTRLSDEVVSQVRSHFKDETFKAVIPRNIRLAEAPSHGLPIIAYFPNSPGAEAHRELAQELLEGDGVQAAVSA
ncbi:MAG: ParA family protein [Anaerolineales bacterium]|nr:MAG: ParA family protein [Anaerolineales bacterium]